MLLDDLSCRQIRHRGGFVLAQLSAQGVRVYWEIWTARASCWVVIVAGVLLWFVAMSVVAEPGNRDGTTPQDNAKGSYLLLVTFYAGPLRDFSSEKIVALDASPYQGIAIPLLGPYETGRFNLTDHAKASAFFKSRSNKDVWPWVFANRFYGSNPKELSHSPLAKSEYFRNINGIDIYNKAGALRDFYDILAGALETAKSTGSPGIVIDLETYNDYSFVKIDHLSQVLRKPEGEVVSRLRQVGSEMMDIVNARYPSAVLWFPVTGLTQVNGSTFNHSFTYIVDGMLQRAKSLNSSAKIIAGGEYTVGYCEHSLTGLRSTLDARDRAYAELLRKYPNLQLGGTIAPWLSLGSRTGWMLSYRNCGDSTIKNLADFTPLVDYMLSTYKYVWIYAASAGGYNPLKNPHQELHIDR